MKKLFTISYNRISVHSNIDTGTPIVPPLVNSPATVHIPLFISLNTIIYPLYRHI